jgi:hypothetical protein
MGMEKLSFHQSGICRKAFTSEQGIPQGEVDRATLKWRRVATERQGMHRFSRVLSIECPTDFLSKLDETTDKPIVWIPPAPVSMTTFVEMGFTREDCLAIQWQLAGSGLRRLTGFLPLPNGENFVVLAGYGRTRTDNLLVPASHHQSKHLMFSRVDPQCIGRPSRLSLYNLTKEKQMLLVQELGGYPILDKDLAHFPEAYRTFSRKEVLAHGSKNKH